MKRLLIILVTILFISETSYSVTYNSDPKIFVQELVGDAIKTLSDKSISVEKKNSIIKKIALENVDILALGMYTLGDKRKMLSPEILEEYNNIFEKYFLKTLTSRLKDYTSNKFEVTKANQKSSNYTIVHSRITESASQPEIKIDWRIYTKDINKPLIRDLIVEGLSLAKTQREEFASILSSNNNDMKILFQKLEAFIQE